MRYWYYVLCPGETRLYSTRPLSPRKRGAFVLVFIQLTSPLCLLHAHLVLFDDLLRVVRPYPAVYIPHSWTGESRERDALCLRRARTVNEDISIPHEARFYWIPLFRRLTTGIVTDQQVSLATTNHLSPVPDRHSHPAPQQDCIRPTCHTTSPTCSLPDLLLLLLAAALAMSDYLPRPDPVRRAVAATAPPLPHLRLSLLRLMAVETSPISPRLRIRARFRYSTPPRPCRHHRHRGGIRSCVLVRRVSRKRD